MLGSNYCVIGYKIKDRLFMADPKTPVKFQVLIRFDASTYALIPFCYDSPFKPYDCDINISLDMIMF